MSVVIDAVLSILCSRSIVTSILSHVSEGFPSSGESIVAKAGWRIGLSRAVGFGGGIVPGDRSDKLPSSLEANPPFGQVSVSNDSWEEGGGERMVRLGLADRGGGSVHGDGSGKGGGADIALHVCEEMCNPEVVKMFVQFLKLTLFREEGRQGAHLVMPAGRKVPLNSLEDNQGSEFIFGVFNFMTNTLEPVHDSDDEDANPNANKDGEEDDDCDDPPKVKKAEMGGDRGLTLLQRSLQKWESRSAGGGEDEGSLSWDDYLAQAYDSGRRLKLERLQNVGLMMSLFAHYALEEGKDVDVVGSDAMGAGPSTITSR